LILCLFRRLTSTALIGVYQQVYKVRHLVWSFHGQDIIAVVQTPHQTASVDTPRAAQSADEDKEHQEKLEEEDDDKRDSEHWNDAQSDSQ